MSIPNQNSIPIIYLDTCSILDIIRDPTRDNILVDGRRASLELLNKAESGKLKVFISERVYREFSDHVQEVQNETERKLIKIRGIITKMDELACIHGASGTIDSSHWNGYVERCRKVADRWLNIGTSMPLSDEIQLKASYRVQQPLAPARRGKDSFKDCLIIETYLEHIDKLRNNGLTAKAVFASSNIRDFAGTRSIIIHEYLQEPFDSLGLQYAPNMGIAKYHLGL